MHLLVFKEAETDEIKRIYFNASGRLSTKLYLIFKYGVDVNAGWKDLKEELKKLKEEIFEDLKGLEFSLSEINSDVMEYVNWCYKNHIDINNLIPIGLANDASKLNIY